MPAAAVIRRGQALSGFIGRKALVGGLLGRELNPGAQPPFAPDTGRLEFGRGRWNSVPNIRISSLKTTNCVEIVEELRRYKIFFTNES